MLPTGKENRIAESDRARQYELKLATLRAAIDEGDASGVASGDVFARVRERLKLGTGEE